LSTPHYTEDSAVAATLTFPSSLTPTYYSDEIVDFSDIALNELSENPCARRFDLSKGLKAERTLAVKASAVKDYFSLEYYEGEQLCDSNDIVISFTFEPSGATIDTLSNPVRYFPESSYLRFYSKNKLKVGTYNVTMIATVTSTANTAYTIQFSKVVLFTLTASEDDEEEEDIPFLEEALEVY